MDKGGDNAMGGLNELTDNNRQVLLAMFAFDLHAHSSVRQQA